MKHQPIAIPRIHAMVCACGLCCPVRTLDGRRIVITAALIFLPVVGLLWAGWTILPR